MSRIRVNRKPKQGTEDPLTGLSKEVLIEIVNKQNSVIETYEHTVEQLKRQRDDVMESYNSLKVSMASNASAGDTLFEDPNSGLTINRESYDNLVSRIRGRYGQPMRVRKSRTFGEWFRDKFIGE